MALREDQDDLAASEQFLGGADRLRVAGTPLDGERPERRKEPREHRVVLEQLALGDVVQGTARHRAEHERVEEAAMVGGDDRGPGCGTCSRPVRRMRR